MGDQAILIEFKPEIDEVALPKILGYKEILKKKLIEVEVEITSTYSSLLIFYLSPIEDIYGALRRVKVLLREANIEKKKKASVFYIPVCYEDEFAPDIGLISEVKNITKKEIIQLHTAPLYTVFFTGFLPGFLYLGGLDENLYFSRRNEPRLKVQKGAVGIGEKQTGIYPQESPGGWQIIGNSPVPLFEQNRNPPCQISAGSKVKFYNVSRDEHASISAKVKAGSFRFKTKMYES